MTRVSNADQVLLLLRERLQRLDRQRGQRSGRSQPTQKGTERPLARLQAAAALDQISEDDFRRTLLRAVLTEELGDGIANDPGFQTIVEDVFRILEESEEGKTLLDRATVQIRAGS